MGKLLVGFFQRRMDEFFDEWLGERLTVGFERKIVNLRKVW